jgi:hypothetical protein
MVGGRLHAERRNRHLVEARDRHRDALHAVTPADVERAVSAWLPRDRAVVGVIDRSVTEAQLKRSQRGAARPARS